MSSKIILKQEAIGNIESVSSWYSDIFVDVADGKVKVKDSSTTKVVASEDYVWTNIPVKANKTEMETGTDDTKFITPLQLKQSNDYPLTFTENTTAQTNTWSPLTTNWTPILFTRPQTIQIYSYAGNSWWWSSSTLLQYSLDWATWWTTIRTFTMVSNSSGSENIIYNVKWGLYLRWVCTWQYTWGSTIIIRYQ